MPPLQSLTTDARPKGQRDDSSSLLSPVAYDDDAASIHSRSDQDTDSDDDQLQLRARNSRELRAADRIVLMEDEELDRLVTDTRRRQERERRGSGLPPIPNPLSIFGRRPTTSSNGQSQTQTRDTSPSYGGSTENLVLSEKNNGGGSVASRTRRQRRRERRREKRERLVAGARHGEDGELMYEMEEGGMKDGSETGDSSERDESDELDRRVLNAVAGAKAQRSRTWRRAVFVYATIVVGFVVLLLTSWRLSLGRRKAAAGDPTPPSMAGYVSNGTALFGPTTLIISLDGFRADFLQRGLTPRLSAFIKEGVSPKYMLPSFPSVTFPNHYTLATGLHPESHGIVGNTFWDPDVQEEFYYSDPARSLDPKWWAGEPFWVTAERQGLRAAIHMWPGSEAHIGGTEPTFLDRYDGKEKLERKVARIFEFLDQPGREDPTVDEGKLRPQLIAAYVPNVDTDGHTFGPNSTQIRNTIAAVDTMLDQIFRGLEERNLQDIVNVIVVSDHGMATTDVTRLIQLEDLVDVSKVAHTDGWPLVGLRPKDPADLPGLHAQLVEKARTNPNIDVYLRDVDMPERYHFRNNPRIAPLWIVPKTGWALVRREEMVVEEARAKGLVYHPRGLHGYDNEHPLMRAIFVARGPAFPHPPNSQVDVFKNTEVYNILCDSLGLTPKPNNGTIRLPLQPVGLHDSTPQTDEPQDPVPPYQSSTSLPSVVAAHTSAASTESPSRSANLVGTSASIVVDPVTLSSVSPPAATTSAPADDEGQVDKAIDEAESKIKDFWDWFTGKVGDIWHKVTGEG